MRTYELTEKAANYFEVEAEMITDFAAAAVGKSVTNKVFGDGKVTAVTGDTFDQMIMTIDFAEETKRFQAAAAIMVTKTMAFVDEELSQLYADMYEKHLEFSNQKRQADNQAAEQAKAEAKRKEEIKKAEAKAEAAKQKALKEFDEMVAQPKTINVSSELYYNIGWLAKHIGTLSAAMPDYLEPAFQRHFGAEAPHRAVDSTKRTVNGFPTQWALSFKASLPKVTEIPATLTQYLNTAGTAVANTSFLWTLVDNHGFKFGKKQDVDAIRSLVPAVHIEAFEKGFNT